MIAVIMRDKNSIKSSVFKQSHYCRQAEFFGIQLQTNIQKYARFVGGNFNDISADLILTSNDMNNHLIHRFAVSWQSPAPS